MWQIQSGSQADLQHLAPCCMQQCNPELPELCPAHDEVHEPRKYVAAVESHQKPQYSKPSVPMGVANLVTPRGLC